MTVTAEQVEAYRAATGLGVYSARRALERKDRLDRIEKLQIMNNADPAGLYQHATLAGILDLLKEMHE